MTLPNIVALQDAIKAACEAVMRGERGTLGEDHWELGKEAVEVMTEGEKHSAKVLVMQQMARRRLGEPGGRAPGGGSFDWEVRPGIGGSVHFIIKSFVDQRTVEKLQAQYARAMGALGGDPYDFR